jgi:hypothetical protein
MSRIRRIVCGTSLFAALAFAMLGGTGINSTMAAGSSSGGQGCIIAILKSGKAQQVNAVAAPSDDEPGCIIAIRKSGGDPENSILTVRKAGGDQHEYYGSQIGRSSWALGARLDLPAEARHWTTSGGLLSIDRIECCGSTPV